MRQQGTKNTKAVSVVAAIVSGALLMAACGGSDGDSDSSAAPAAEAPAAAPADAAAPAAAPEAAPAVVDAAPAAPAAPAAAAPAAPAAAAAPKAAAAAPAPKAAAPKAAAAPAPTGKTSSVPADNSLNPQGPAPAAPGAGAGSAAPAGATLGESDTGVSATEIKTGGVNMHGMPLGNLLIDPQVRAMNAAAAAINDAGGVLGRKLKYIDCDDGPGETSRAKACMKKLVEQDKLFSFLTSTTWSTASMGEDLARYQIPLVGAWAYTHVEWADPWQFPTHTSMLHEANAGAEWVLNVIKPKTFGLICLNAPEMQKSCANVNRVLSNAGAKMVHKVDITLTPGDLSAEVVAMRSKNPDHIIHYVINPASIAKFIVDSAQQQYWPPKGLSGNHMATEIMGEIFGEWPVGRYWTNTTYKTWGIELVALMRKYAPNNQGLIHHIIQAGVVATNVFAKAATRVGPDLTREKLMAVLNTPGEVWDAGFGIGQSFMWGGGRELDGPPGAGAETAARHEYMYKYTDTRTTTNKDMTANGFTPDPDMFEIRDTQDCCYTAN